MTMNNFFVPKYVYNTYLTLSYMSRKIRRAPFLNTVEVLQTGDPLNFMMLMCHREQLLNIICMLGLFGKNDWHLPSRHLNSLQIVNISEVAVEFYNLASFFFPWQKVRCGFYEILTPLCLEVMATAFFLLLFFLWSTFPDFFLVFQVK